ncbi:hypothetical protein IG631_09442 [Alternaria alternata]|nr:hypothetical protein IG631_09442 [Alternaria alternata]
MTEGLIMIGRHYRHSTNKFARVAEGSSVHLHAMYAGFREHPRKGFVVSSEMRLPTALLRLTEGSQIVSSRPVRVRCSISDIWRDSL